MKRHLERSEHVNFMSTACQGKLPREVESTRQIAVNKVLSFVTLHARHADKEGGLAVFFTIPCNQMIVPVCSSCGSTCLLPQHIDMNNRPPPLTTVTFSVSFSPRVSAMGTWERAGEPLSRVISTPPPLQHSTCYSLPARPTSETTAT